MGETATPSAGFTATVAGRVSGALFMGCGGLTALLLPLSPTRAEAEPTLALLVAISAFVCGVVIFFLPWHRWGLQSTLWLVPTALVHIAGFNAFAAEPYLYDLYFLVAMVWLGAFHRPGTSLRVAPLVLVAYLVPGPLLEEPRMVLISAAYVVPICVFVGEAVAWVASKFWRSEDERRRADARFAAVIQQAGDVILICDAVGRIAYASPACERLLHEPEGALRDRDLWSLVHPDDRIPLADAQDHDSDHLRSELEFRLRDRRGDWRWLEGIIRNLLHDPDVQGVVINARDITRRRAADELLAQIAYHDSLTGLPNRAGFLRALERQLLWADAPQPLSVLFLDLDGFKRVNDTLGHAVGDVLLVEVGARLSAAMGERELLARLGGDEFVVLAPEDDAERLTALATRILAALALPFEMGERELVVSASIGIATAVSGIDDAGSLFLKADLAMYQAKSAGKARWAVYDDSLALDARRRLDLEAELRRAVERDEFTMHYQPEIDLDTGRVASVEALVRWDHPTRGRLAPGDFIATAEEMGLIVPIGSWVLRESARQAAVWLDRLAGQAPVMSVNVSVHQLRHAAFVQEVEDVLRTSGLPAGHLRLEMTETILADASIEPVLARLRALGVRIAIDDLGTGYSSLGYLHRFPVDTLKIDRSFLEPIVEDDDRSPVVEAIVAMGHSLDLTVVAEGVETAAQVAVLRRLGCDRAQGYLFGRPRAAAEVERVLGIRQSTQGAGRAAGTGADAGVGADDDAITLDLPAGG